MVARIRHILGFLEQKASGMHIVYPDDPSNAYKLAAHETAKPVFLKEGARCLVSGIVEGGKTMHYLMVQTDVPPASYAKAPSLSL